MKRISLIATLLLAPLIASAQTSQPYTVSVGTTANDGTGDPLRTAFGKINTNTSTIYQIAIQTNDSRAVLLTNKASSFSGNGNGLTNLASTNLTGAVQLANGGTGQTTVRGAQAIVGINPISKAGGGSFFDYANSSPAAEGQLGVANYNNYNFALFAGKSTTQGDWLHSFAFPTGITQIGDSDMGDPGVGLNPFWYIACGSANWNIGNSDSCITFKQFDRHPLNSGIGLNLGIMYDGFGVTSVTINNGGSGYVVGDTLEILGGVDGFGNTILNGFVYGARLTVLTVNGGGTITSVKVVYSGEYSTAPATTAAATGGGTGTGATFNTTTSAKGITVMGDNSCAFNHVPANRTNFLMPGNAMFVFNENDTHMKGLVVCSPSLPGYATGTNSVDHGNYSLGNFDFKHRAFRGPIWHPNFAFQPDDAGWNDLWFFDPLNANIKFNGGFFVGGSQWNRSDNTNNIEGARLDPNSKLVVSNVVCSLSGAGPSGKFDVSGNGSGLWGDLSYGMSVKVNGNQVGVFTSLGVAGYPTFTCWNGTNGVPWGFDTTPRANVSIEAASNIVTRATMIASAITVTNAITFNSGPIVQTGSGSPNSVVTAPVGSIFYRTDGGAGTTLYVKESGTGNSGWVGK